MLVSALVLDFLSIHPFVDGNGRVARLLTTHELLRHGYGVARYVSLEQRIFDAQSSYYETLQESQRGWHDGSARHLAVDGVPAAPDRRRLRRSRGARGRTAGPAGSTKEAQAREYILRHGPGDLPLARPRGRAARYQPASLRNALAALKAEGAVSSGLGRSAVWVRRA